MNKNHPIAVIGAGKLAWSFVPALTEAGYNVRCIISRNLSSAEELAEHYKIKEYSDSLYDLPSNCKILLLSVPDDQLSDAASQLSSLNLSGNLFIHFSGVYSSDILKELTYKGGSTASFHIMQTFPARKKISIKNSYAAVETHFKEAEDFLYTLASDIELNAFTIPADKKTEYHLAGVFASNFFVANMHAAAKLFGLTGSKIDFNQCINPILEHTLKNIFSNGAVNALSGPVERGDFHTIKLHIKSLQTDVSLLRSYLVQSLNIIDIKKEQGGITPALEEIEIYLIKMFKNNYL
jgi:predicted short-subunit dehydrogenase-like oxidoreductase (DUF2520 family)